MVDHVAIIKAQNQDEWVSEEVTLTEEVYNAIIGLAKDMDLSLDEYINYTLRLFILNKEFNTDNAVFDTDMALMSEEQIEELFEDLPFYIHSSNGNAVCISPEEYNSLKGTNELQ